MVGIHNIVELNSIIKEKSLEYKIHISDACGGASMWIEVLSAENSADNKDKNTLLKIIEDYFEKERIKLKWSEDKMAFWTAN